MSRRDKTQAGPAEEESADQKAEESEIAENEEEGEDNEVEDASSRMQEGENEDESDEEESDESESEEKAEGEGKEEKEEKEAPEGQPAPTPVPLSAEEQRRLRRERRRRSAGTGTSRGAYLCSRCGQPKRGHSCPFAQARPPSKRERDRERKRKQRERAALEQAGILAVPEQLASPPPPPPVVVPFGMEDEQPDETLMEMAVRSAVAWNKRLLEQRRARGPIYWDPHTRTYQVYIDPAVQKSVVTSKGSYEEKKALVEKLMKEEEQKLEHPKPPLTAFFHFSNCIRNELKAKYADATLGDLSRLTSQKWRNMTDEEKMPYEKMAQEDKQRYEAEMRALKQRLEQRRREIIRMVDQMDLTKKAKEEQEAEEQKERERERERKQKARERRLRDPNPKCVYCGMDGKTEELLTCSECYRRYHPSKCLQLPAETVQTVREMPDWRCTECKTCEVCRDPGQDDKMLFCDKCDRGFHTFCCDPPLARPPSGGWRCKQCVVCKSCGATSPGAGLKCKWRLDYTSCDACYQLFLERKYCPVCMRVYRHFDKTPMVACDQCNWWIHASCDDMDQETYNRLSADPSASYVCPKCRSGNPPPFKMNEGARRKYSDQDEQFEVVYDQGKGQFVQRGRPNTDAAPALSTEPTPSKSRNKRRPAREEEKEIAEVPPPPPPPTKESRKEEEAAKEESKAEEPAGSSSPRKNKNAKREKQESAQRKAQPKAEAKETEMKKAADSSDEEPLVLKKKAPSRKEAAPATEAPSPATATPPPPQLKAPPAAEEESRVQVAPRRRRRQSTGGRNVAVAEAGEEAEEVEMLPKKNRRESSPKTVQPVAEVQEVEQKDKAAPKQEQEEPSEGPPLPKKARRASGGERAASQEQEEAVEEDEKEVLPKKNRKLEPTEAEEEVSLPIGRRLRAREKGAEEAQHTRNKRRRPPVSYSELDGDEDDDMPVSAGRSRRK